MTHFGGMKQCKCMVVLRDFPLLTSDTTLFFLDTSKGEHSDEHLGGKKKTSVDSRKRMVIVLRGSGYLVSG